MAIDMMGRILCLWTCSLWMLPACLSATPSHGTGGSLRDKGKCFLAEQRQAAGLQELGRASPWGFEV